MKCSSTPTHPSSSAPRSSGGRNWTADPVLWGPEGLPPLVAAGLRFTLYSCYWNQVGRQDFPAACTLTLLSAGTAFLLPTH